MAQYRATAAVLLLLVAALAPQNVLAQAAAFAGAGNAFAAAGAGFATPSPAPAPACKTSASIVPWGVPSLIFGQPAGLLTPNNATYSDVTLCCGSEIIFNWTRPHGVFQLASRTCPATFTGGPDGQLLHPITSNGTASLSFGIPGTYFITSPSGQDCQQGMLFAVTVPADSSNPQCVAGGPSASASGTPGGTSTSTGPNSAAAASGPPGTTQTFTSNGLSFSSAGR